MNKKQIFLEYQEPNQVTISEEVVDEKTGEKSLKVHAVWQQAGVLNRNNRKYSKDILARECKRINERIAKGETVWGCNFHSDRASDISHRWDVVTLDEKTGVCEGDMTILNTRAGQDVAAILRAGRLGLSSKGTGNVTKKTETIDGKEVTFDSVNDDFRLLTPGDFVIAQSVQGAGASVQEGLKDIEDQLNNKEIEEGEPWDDKLDVVAEADSLIELDYEVEKANKTFVGTLKEYQEERYFDQFLEAIIALNEDMEEAGKLKRGSLERFLKEFMEQRHSGEKDITKNGQYNEARLAGFKGSLSEWETLVDKVGY